MALEHVPHPVKGKHPNCSPLCTGSCLSPASLSLEVCILGVQNCSIQALSRAVWAVILSVCNIHVTRVRYRCVLNAFLHPSALPDVLSSLV